MKNFFTIWIVIGRRLKTENGGVRAWRLSSQL